MQESRTPDGEIMIYNRIKELRVDKDLGQKELAEILNVTRSAYSNYENGLRDVPVEVLVRLADFYKTSVDYIVGRTDRI